MVVSSPSLDELIEEGRRLNDILDKSVEELGIYIEEEAKMDVDPSPLEASGAPKTDGLFEEPLANLHMDQAVAPAGHWKQRTPLLPSRVTGCLQEVKGRFGWIWPDRPIIHPDAGMHEGRIYLSHRDVETEISGVGAHVSFLLYADGSGLGAMNCRPAEPEELEAMPSEWQVPPSSVGRGQGHGSRGGTRGGGQGEACPAASVEAADAQPAQVVSPPRPEPRTVAPPEPRIVAPAREAQGKQGTWQPGEGAVTVRPPLKRSLEMSSRNSGRTRISETPLLGVVRSWKGSYGWIEPVEPVRHPLFNGKLFLHINDVASADPPDVGLMMAFLLYVDPDGLGAEHCTPQRSSAAELAARAATPAASQPVTPATPASHTLAHVPVTVPAPRALQPSPSAASAPSKANMSSTCPGPCSSPEQGQAFAASPPPPALPLQSVNAEETVKPPGIDQDMAKRLAAWMENREG